MTKETLKSFILDNALTKSGKLNNRACIQTWWDNRSTRDIHDKIISETSHLDIYTPSFAERLYSIVHDTTDRPTCQVCNKNKNNFMNYSEGYRDYCSVSCVTKSPERNAKVSKAVKEAIPVMMGKLKITNLERYGSENYYSTKDFKEKSRKTKLERYGDENYCNREQAKDTNMERYGVPYTTQTKKMIDCSRQARMETNPEIWDADWLIRQNSTKGVTQIAEELEVSYRTVYLALERLGIDQKIFHTHPLKMQTEIYEFVVSLGVDATFCDKKTIAPKEIDIMIDSHKVGIELNGVYWHSLNEGYTIEDKNKHTKKTKLCNEKGVRLIQILDTEWLNKKDICKDIIRRSLHKTENIHYARKMQVQIISNKEYADFLDNHHIQGTANAKFKYGLFLNGLLYSVMSFGTSRFEKNKQELIRFCTMPNNHIIGGAEKLLRFHIRNSDTSNLLTYCDNRLFEGSVYSKIGFKKVSDGTIDYVWIDNRNNIISRYKTQKHKLKSLLGASFNPDDTEDKNMFKHKFKKLYGCGHSKWEYIVK
jgi:hypothetical protein